jgi:hypothetical protein
VGKRGALWDRPSRRSRIGLTVGEVINRLVPE